MGWKVRLTLKGIQHRMQNTGINTAKCQSPKEWKKMLTLEEFELGTQRAGINTAADYFWCSNEPTELTIPKLTRTFIVVVLC